MRTAGSSQGASGAARGARCAVFTKNQRARHNSAGCPGFATLLLEVLLESRRHGLQVAAVAGSSLVYCVACGAWATSTGKRGISGGLLAPCRRVPTAYGTRCLRRLAAGKFPEPGSQRLIEGTWSRAEAFHANSGCS